MANHFSFDDSEFSDRDGSSDEAADQALASIEEQEAETAPEQDSELVDVDLRLETADHYRAILKHEFFDAKTEASGVVDREIRAFIRERLEVLLGLRSEKAPAVKPQFEEDEVQALKLLASKVLKKPALVSEPVVSKMPAPAPRQLPTLKVANKVAPKKIPAPAPTPSTKPKAKAQTQAPKPAEAKKPKRSVAPSNSSTAKVVDRLIDNGETQSFVNMKGETVTLTEGEVLEENGQRFVVARNEAGTLYRKNITGQVAPPNRAPPMSLQQMSIMSQQFAEQQLASLDETTGLAIVASLQRQE